MTADRSARRGVDLWVGAYTADSAGTAEGIGTLHVEEGVPHWSGVAVETPSPSFLARHPRLPLVYAVGESAQTVTAFHIRARGRLQPAGVAWDAGASACHVAVDPQGRYLVVCCWGDGQVLLYELDADGGLRNRLTAAPARDPHPAVGGMRHTRAHAALILPDSRIATTDLGVDLLRLWRYEPGVGLVADHEVAFPEGSEPRHLVRHPSGRILVVGEASAAVFVLVEGDDGRFAIESSSPATRDPERAGPAAEISLDEDGRTAHVGIRGTNRIATLAVHDDGARLEALADVDCCGRTPRHHWESEQLLLVANQDSSTVTSFRLDAATGIPTRLLATAPVPSPAFLLPFGGPAVE